MNAFLYLLTHPALNLAAAAFALGLRVGQAIRVADEKEGQR